MNLETKFGTNKKIEQTRGDIDLWQTARCLFIPGYFFGEALEGMIEYFKKTENSIYSRIETAVIPLGTSLAVDFVKVYAYCILGKAVLHKFF